MTTNQRILVAVALVLVDLVLFAVPATALVAAYVVLARPPWFRRFVDTLYAEVEPGSRP